MSHERDALVGVEGSVKWFDPRKGFGFLVGPEGQDIFVHFSVIDGDGFKVLRDGARVVYDAANGDKGWKATKVRRAPTITVVDRAAMPQDGSTTAG
jgi:cold shock protein